MAEFPALPLWTDAYLADTTHLSTIEHGAYMLLLMAMWRSKGVLPNDDRLLARYSKLTAGQWKRIKPVIWPFFEEQGEVITQRRIQKEMAYVRERSDKAAKAAQKRWNAPESETHLTAMGTAVRQQEDSSENGEGDKALKNNDAAYADASPGQSGRKAPTPTPTPTTDTFGICEGTQAVSEDEKPKPQKRATRLPDGWEPGSAEIAFARNEGMTDEQIRRTADRFKDYWHGIGGAKGAKRNWLATWRNWVRSDIDRQSNGARNARGRSPHQTLFDAGAAVAARYDGAADDDAGGR